jgi:hypothetical protein
MLIVLLFWDVGIYGTLISRSLDISTHRAVIIYGNDTSKASIMSMSMSQPNTSMATSTGDVEN